MSLYLGTQLLAGVATNTIYNAHTLLDFKWTDHLLNDQSWLRADTFSWQDGTVYSNAYNHLVDDYTNGTSSTETVGSYTITYVLATDGHKITTDETNVANIYNESGGAWYYILDTTNQRFKLPRTKYGFVGLRDTVGKYIPESLPNIKDEIVNHWRDYGAHFALTPSGNLFYDKGLNSIKTSFPNVAGSSGGSYTGDDVIGIDASRVSTTYQDNAPVQQRATQMYLYFYVGQYSQSATEQTAGLNSELFNGKLDLNAQNLSTQGKSLISGLGMPSSTYDDLTLGASGTEYIAPANGWFVIDKAANGANQFVRLKNKTSLLECALNVHASGNAPKIFIPCLKGDVVMVGYDLGGATNAFRFIYAEGEV